MILGRILVCQEVLSKKTIKEGLTALQMECPGSQAKLNDPQPSMPPAKGAVLRVFSGIYPQGAPLSCGQYLRHTFLDYSTFCHS